MSVASSRSLGGLAISVCMATLLLVGPARGQSSVAAQWAKAHWAKVLWEKPGSGGCRFGTFAFMEDGEEYCGACTKGYTWVGSSDPEYCYECLPAYTFGLFPNGYMCYACPSGYTLGPVGGGVYQCNPPAPSSPSSPTTPPSPPPSASLADPSCDDGGAAAFAGEADGGGGTDHGGHDTRRASGSGSVGVGSGSGSGSTSSPGASGGGSSGSGASLGDLLRDFSADADEAGEPGPSTRLVDEDILRDIEMEFLAAADRFEDCYVDFKARLEALAGESSEVICADAAISAPYACAEGAYTEVDDAYTRAHALLRRRLPGTEWEELTDENYDLYPDDVSAMDRISILLINSRFDQVAATLEKMREELATRAPACDPDDLMNGGAATAGGWGADGPGGSGAGSGTGGGEVSEGVHFRKIGEPTVSVTGIKQGTCPGYVPQGGEYMAFVRNDMPDFPDEIWPDTVVRSWFHGGMWHVSGHDGNAEVVCTIYFMSPGNVKQVNKMGGGGRDYEFDTSKVDFSQRSGVITMVTGGNIDCREGDQLVIGPETITQAYERVGE